MIEVESRRQARYALDRQAPGIFHLKTARERHRVTVVRDISTSGIRVFTDAYTPQDTDVVLEYAEANLHLDLKGRVAWCTANDEVRSVAGARYVVGLHLYSPFLFLSMAGLY